MDQLHSAQWNVQVICSTSEDARSTQSEDGNIRAYIIIKLTAKERAKNTPDLNNY